MPRPRRHRFVEKKPEVTYFKPAGVRMKDLDDSVLTVDEFEAVRLKDLESMDQSLAAKKMGISQPTFHRLVLSARKKIADAIVNGKAIKIEGGRIKMRGNFQRGFGGPPTKCVCPKCGNEQEKTRGVRCIDVTCKKCGAKMIGEK